MRKIECARCGCDRKKMIKTPCIRIQEDKDNMNEFTYHHLCIPCFLKLIGIEDKTVIPKELWYCMPEED